MKKLVERRHFPLLAFVRADPDEIRRFLPEYHLYIKMNPELAGELTNKESGFITEILTLAGLKAGKNVLVDGSLRDASWYRRYFQELRIDFPSLRLSIIHVTAPRDVVFERAAVRDASFYLLESLTIPGFRAEPRSQVALFHAKSYLLQWNKCLNPLSF